VPRSSTVPIDRAGRLQAVGVALYGSAWRKRLAAGLRISRSTLHGWMTGSWETPRDLDGDLIALLDAERDGCAERSIALTALRQQLMLGR
jgi:hypothetical protein